VLGLGMVRPQHEIEETLQTYLHIRVLKELASSSTPQTKYMLAKKCGVGQKKVESIVEVLKKNGWVKEHVYLTCKYSINYMNPKVGKFLDFLSAVGYLRGE